MPNIVHMKLKKKKRLTIPCFATITLETASGTLVPAAKNVMPITESGIFNVSPEKMENIFEFCSL